MADAPDPISSPPAQDFQPYDSTDEGPVSGWVSVDSNGGPADSSGQASGDFEDGPSPWKQV